VLEVKSAIGSEILVINLFRQLSSQRREKWMKLWSSCGSLNGKSLS
jgi:hypothetical protein